MNLQEKVPHPESKMSKYTGKCDTANIPEGVRVSDRTHNLITSY